jgi:FAD/FMN-containing dehydrogenase
MDSGLRRGNVGDASMQHAGGFVIASGVHHSPGGICHNASVGLDWRDHVEYDKSLKRPTGTLELSTAEHGDLFRATIGGMGLTGIISFVELKLIRSAFLDVERIAFANITEFFELAAESAAQFEHTVAWVDCATNRAQLGRGIFERGRWCEDGDLRPHAAGTW